MHKARIHTHIYTYIRVHIWNIWPTHYLFSKYKSGSAPIPDPLLFPPEAWPLNIIFPRSERPVCLFSAWLSQESFAQRSLFITPLITLRYNNNNNMLSLSLRAMVQNLFDKNIDFCISVSLSPSMDYKLPESKRYDILLLLFTSGPLSQARKEWKTMRVSFWSINCSFLP